MNYFYLGLINNRLVLLFIFLALKIAMGVSFFFLKDKEFIITKWYYLFICLTISYIVMFLFNILFYISTIHLYFILEYYEENVFKSGIITFASYKGVLFVYTIFSIIEIINIINAIFLAYKLKRPKINNIELEKGLMEIN